MKYRYLLTITLIVAITAPLRAQNSGVAAADFMNMSVSARTAGTAASLSALSDGPISSYYNPAGLTESKLFQVAGMHSEWYQDLRYEFLGLAIPTHSAGTFGLSLTYLGMGEIKAYSASNTPMGNVSAYDWSLGFSYARQMSPSISIGTGMKTINEKLDNVDAQGWAGDLGIQYRHQNIGVGLAVMNLGPKIKYDTESSPLPTRIDAGVSYQPTIGNLNLIAGMVFPLHGNPGFKTGFEYTYARLLTFRSGYNSAEKVDNQSGLSLGAGFNIINHSLDYAYNLNGLFGGTHQISFVLRFGQPKAPVVSNMKVPQSPQGSEVVRSAEKRSDQRKRLVCAGRYSALDNAQKHLEALKAFGFSPKIMQGGQGDFLVVLGKADDDAKAAKMKTEYEKKGVSCFIEEE